MNITIGPNEADQRFDRFCRKYFKQYPEIKLGDIFSWIRKGAIKVNGRKRPEKYRLVDGDIVTRHQSAETDKSALDATQTKEEKVARIDIEQVREHLVFEDDNWLVFNKPAGLVVHPGNKHETDITMHDMLISYLQQTNGYERSETFKPAFCYRLDKDTSGILIAAKNYHALQTLNEMIRLRKTSKEYKAVVAGTVTNEITIDQPLFVGFDKKAGRGKTFINVREGKEATSIIKPVKSRTHDDLGPISLVAVTIITGRMHQIRVHAASVNHPVIGDIMYGNPAVNRIASKQVGITRQLLHCETYGFFDPFKDKQVYFNAPIPKTFTHPCGFSGVH